MVMQMFAIPYFVFLLLDRIQIMLPIGLFQVTECFNASFPKFDLIAHHCLTLRCSISMTHTQKLLHNKTILKLAW
jgi:hypothetical protein